MTMTPDQIAAALRQTPMPCAWCNRGLYRRTAVVRIPLQSPKPARGSWYVGVDPDDPRLPLEGIVVNTVAALLVRAVFVWDGRTWGNDKYRPFCSYRCGLAYARQSLKGGRR